jgi:acetolactate synthase-1/3 small subunit
VEIFRGKIVDVSPRSFVIEITGGQEKIDAIARLLEPLGLQQVVRTGPLAGARGGPKTPAEPATEEAPQWP